MVPFFPRRSTPFLRHVVFIMDTELKKMSLKSVIGVRNDAIIASRQIAHTPASLLTFWGWFFLEEGMLYPLILAHTFVNSP